MYEREKNENLSKVWTISWNANGGLDFSKLQ